MAQVELLKKVGKYIDKKDDKEKTYVNFYVRCGDELIPVEVKFFEGEDGHDYRYSGRKAVLSAFAERFPEKKETDGKKQSKKESKKVDDWDDDSDVPF